MSNRRAAIALFVLSLQLAACARVDLSPQAGAFATALGETTKPLLPQVIARAAAEDAAARTAAMRKGEKVYDITPACQDIAQTLIGVDLADCKLEPLVAAPVVAGSGKLAEQQLAALQAYADTLLLITSSKLPGEVGQSVADLASALEGLGKSRASMARLALRAATLREPVGGLATLLAEARRASILRRLVREADAPVQKIIRSLINDLARSDGVLPAYQALVTATGDEVNARASENPARIAVAVAALEASHRAFVAQVASSDMYRLMLLGTAQVRLSAAARRPTTPEEFLDLAEAVRKLAGAL